MENPAFSTICRTCMSNGQDFHSILEHESVYKLQISEMLMATVPQLHIQPVADKLPTLLCGECLNKLNIAYHYQKLCIQTDKCLKEMLVYNVVEGFDGKQQQKDEEERQIMEAYQTKMLLPKETTPDFLEQNGEAMLQRLNSCNAIDNEHECDGFFYDHEQDEDNLFKAVAAATAEDVDGIEDCNRYISGIEWKDKSDEDKIDINTVKPKPNATTGIFNYHKEPDTNKVEKPDVCNDHKENHPCPDCQEDIDRPYHLRRPTAVHSIKQLHECDTDNHLNLYKTIHSNDALEKSEAPPAGYQCEYCPKKFKKCTLLAKHAATHPENQKFKCNLCEKTFSLNARLIEHLKEHDKLNKFKCKHCNKVFQQNASLKEHMNTHTGETPHLCPQCGKSFKHRSTMRQHLLRHSNEKRFGCEECISKFACPSDLSKHMAVHRTCNVHICDICGSSFSRSSTLKKHKLQHSGKRPHKCKECDMSFVFAHHLRSHMRTHTGQKPHKCKYCGSAFAERGDLNKHLRTHVGENTYMCDNCPKAFKYKKDLQFHKVQHFKQQLELDAKRAVSASNTSPTATVTSKEFTENQNQTIYGNSSFPI